MPITLNEETLSFSGLPYETRLGINRGEVEKPEAGW
jgi:hypothetical protein